MTDALSHAERDVVGICATWPDWLDVLDLAPHHFDGPQWRRCYEAMLDLRARRDAIEEATIHAELERRGWADSYSDLIEACLNAPPVGDSAEAVAAIVRDGAVRRAVVHAMERTAKLHEFGETGEGMLTDALRRLSEIDTGGGRAGATIGELIRQRSAELDELAAAKARGEEGMTGIPTGLEELDKLLGGIQRGIVTVVAGRPGMGKSAFGQAISDSASAAGHGVHVFSLEDTRAAYTDRAMARVSRVPGESIRTLALSNSELGSISRATRSLRERAGWYVDDRSGISADEVVRSVRRNRRENGTRLVLVDYLQLLKGRRGESKQEKAADAMVAFANAAKADDMAYVVFSQLNRGCEYRDDKRPILSDLRDAGEIEEYAKAVLFLFRPRVYHDDAPEDEIEIIARKNNHGQTGTVSARWDGPTTRIF